MYHETFSNTSVQTLSIYHYVFSENMYSGLLYKWGRYKRLFCELFLLHFSFSSWNGYQSHRSLLLVQSPCFYTQNTHIFSRFVVFFRKNLEEFEVSFFRRFFFAFFGSFLKDEKGKKSREFHDISILIFFLTVFFGSD